MNKDTRFDHKVFFVPDIYVVDGYGKAYRVAYINERGHMTYSAWAGRVLPNEQVGHGTSKELKDMLQYDGDFSIEHAEEIQPVADNKGAITPRYAVSLVLSKKLVTGVEVFGSKTTLQEVSALDVPDKALVAEILQDPEIHEILNEFDLLDDSYKTQREVFNALDEIANDWLLNDLASAEAQDLAETDSEKRKTAINATIVRDKIYKIELKMQEINPDYKPTAHDPIKLSDWNPPRTASLEDFYKEYAYYFGNNKSKVEEAAKLYIKYHPEAKLSDVTSSMLKVAT